jgi:sulfoxide reductase heme-binding subunit YedZ
MRGVERHLRRAARLEVAIVAAVALLSGAVIALEPYPVERELLLARVTGYGAVASLAAALLATPALRMWTRLGRAAPSKATVSAYRRAFGKAAAWLALAHGALMFFTYLGSEVLGLVRPYLRSGGLAALLLALLLLTSYPRVVRALRVRLWKELHRLAYVAALLVVHHLALAPFAPKRAVFLGAALFALAWATRFLPTRRPWLGSRRR